MNSKTLHQTYKGIDVDIINEVAKRKNWDVNQTYPGFDAAVNAVSQDKQTPHGRYNCNRCT